MFIAAVVVSFTSSQSDNADYRTQTIGIDGGRNMTNTWGRLFVRRVTLKQFYRLACAIIHHSHPHRTHRSDNQQLRPSLWLPSNA